MNQAENTSAETRTAPLPGPAAELCGELVRPPQCAAPLHDGRPCERDATEDIIGIDLCQRHHERLVADVIQRDRYEQEHREVQWRRAEERLRSLERVRPSFRKENSGWTFYLGLPGFEGKPRQQIRKRGIKRKIDAQREAAAILQSLKGPLASSVEEFRLAVDQQKMDASERWARQLAQMDAEAQAAYSSTAIAKRERERQRLVYYVRRPDGAIKIGTTWNLKTRMQAFRNATPVELLAHHSGGQVAEAALHRRFAHLRLDGEWFSPGQDLLAHIRHVRSRADRREEAP